MKRSYHNISGLVRGSQTRVLAISARVEKTLVPSWAGLFVLLSIVLASVIWAFKLATSIYR